MHEVEAWEGDSGDARLLRRYEEAIAEACAWPHAIAFTYSRIGLVAFLRAAGLRPGDEVILSPLTCKVVPLALLSMGLQPIYADISPATLNLDPASVLGATGPATRAVLFQHTYGNGAGIEAVADLCIRKSLVLVEDCAQCVPTRAPHFSMRGSAAFFSNNPRKPVPAGSGGIVVVADEAIAESVRSYRNQLSPSRFMAEARWRLIVWMHDFLVGPRTYWPLFQLARMFGSIYRDRTLAQEIEFEVSQRATRPSRFHAHRGLAYLSYTERLAHQRTMSCAYYAQRFRDFPELTPTGIDFRTPLYFYPILAANKDLLLRLSKRRLLEVVAWPLRLPIYPVESEGDLLRYGYTAGSCVAADAAAARLVGLPTDFGATEQNRAALATLVEMQHVDPS